MEFRPDYPGVAAVVRAATEATAPRLAALIHADSQRYVPVLSGDLRASGRIECDGSTWLVVYGGGESDVDYAGYQEFGTTKMQAQPYLRPAAYTYRGSL